MNPVDSISTKTALIGRQPCGCFAVFTLGASPEKRSELEAEGYSVEEMPLAEARKLLRDAHDTCTHGSTQVQLAAKVKEQAERIEQLEEHSRTQGREVDRLLADQDGPASNHDRILGTCVEVEHSPVGTALIILTSQEDFDAFNVEPLEAEVEVRIVKPKTSPN